MKNRKWIAMGIGLSVLAAGIWIFGVRHMHTEDDAQKTSMEETPLEHVGSDVESRVASLEMANLRMHHQVANMQHNIPATADSPSDSPVSADENDSEPLLSAEEQLEQDKLLNLQILETMANVLGGQPDDPDWSQEASDAFEMSLRDNALRGTRIDEVQCKTSICRVSLSHDGTTDFEAFRANGLRVNMKISGVYFSYNVETNTSVVYLAKQGYTLPMPL
ncbi:MAG: hypothetical protein JXR76_03040 [Deltaproteobacteria bacterium]|nr:hypothetical protein [Deltaproteobacteria bacterium]